MSNSDQHKSKRRRQWGAERRIQPLPMLHDRPSTRKIALSRMAIVFTIGFWLLFIASILQKLFDTPLNYQFTMEALSYMIVMTCLTFSALMYLVARQGAYQRFSKHTRVPRAELDHHFADNQPSITVLVPSYSEEPPVIRKTLLSAALQEYPGMRVVLLLDDKPYPASSVAAARLETTRQLARDIEDLLDEPYSRFSRALDYFEQSYTPGQLVNSHTVQNLASQYAWAATWLNNMADHEDMDDHVDQFFADQVLRQLANDLQLVSRALLVSSEQGAHLPGERIHQLYRRLVWTFEAELAVFERKKYTSVSHESNKAMNLNTYIGLMGGTYRPEQTPDGLLLMPVDQPQDGDMIIPDSDFLLTLDADSILLREYCLRLIYFLQQPDNARVAVTQTPYSSFRGAATRIERLAGATTDVQHILHQGMSHYDATFWVGANAVIRKKALEDIASTEWVGGFAIRRFIQDRTVIEDTESSIDLTFYGWTLVNYPERLSYSATPPDFGSLVVQRRRWANGGLLILPKLWAQIRRRQSQNQLVSRTEVMLRLNYMASIAWSSVALILVLAYPYNGRLLSPFVLLAAVPYFMAMASDLKYCGYNRSDIFRIYGFNIILLPVNMAGVLKSLQQAVTAKKIPFARTPKVKDRTAASLTFVLVPLLIVAFSTFMMWLNIKNQNWGNAIFAGFNAFAASWAIVAYIGIGNTIVDIWLGLTNWLYVEVKPQSSHQSGQAAPTLNWQAVLYHGETKGLVPHDSRATLVTDTVAVAERPVL